jgi:hypothetical protein
VRIKRILQHKHKRRCIETQGASGESGFIVNHAVYAPAVVPEWYVMEIEEDNVTQESRARLYLKSSSPGAEDGWTGWVEHHAATTYAGTEGQIFGRLGGTMEFDNWYVGDAGGGGTLEGDINGDGITNGLDRNILGENWQVGVSAPGQTVPEPTTLALLGIGAIAMLSRRHSA